MKNERIICRYTEGSSDEPSCPKCGGYNAMLKDHSLDRVQRLMRDVDFRKCRDCGVLAVRED